MGMGPQLMVTPMVGDKDSTLPSFSSLPGTLEYWRPQLERWIDRSNAWSRDVCFFSQIWRHVFCCFFLFAFFWFVFSKSIFFGGDTFWRKTWDFYTLGRSCLWFPIWFTRYMDRWWFWAWNSESISQLGWLTLDASRPGCFQVPDSKMSLCKWAAMNCA